MAEDDFFDATLKKKKKKKKIIALDDDDATAEAPAAAGGDDEAPAAAAAPAGGDDDQDVDEVAAMLSDELDLGKKKKKKKKKITFDPDALGDEPAEEGGDDAGDAGAEAPDDDIDIDALGDELALPAKKKKKKKKEVARPTAAVEDIGAVDTADKPAWADSDRDYKYEELLQRVFDIMRQKNPEMMTNAKKTFVMKPPQVMKVGSKKTAFVNFTEICKLLHRQPEHFLGFILAELGTSGSVDGNQSLVLKGRFTQRNMETVLKGYIREYVTCKLCKSPNTILAKENRLFFLQCETCGSKRSVASIKTGYQAQIGRRSAMRAKTST